jgi:hypothetical protein
LARASNPEATGSAARAAVMAEGDAEATALLGAAGRAQSG